MSTHLARTDFDSEEFVAHLAGRYRDCNRLAESIGTLTVTTTRRIEAMRRNAYLGLAEIGESLLLLGEARPGEFDDWFRAHAGVLGFSARTADRCKAAAQMIRTHGFDEALRLALESSPAPRPEPWLSLRLTCDPFTLSREEAAALLAKILPVYQRLEERLAEPETA